MLLGGGYFQFLKEVCCDISKRDVEWLKVRHTDPNARNLRDTFLHLRLGRQSTLYPSVLQALIVMFIRA